MKQLRMNRNTIWTKRYQRWLFPAVLLLTAAAVALTFSFLSSSGRVRLKESAYQFCGADKIVFHEGTDLICGKYNVIFKQGQEHGEGDKTPIYSQNTRQLILSDNMYWLDPVSGREWLIPALSSLKIDGSGAIYCSAVNGKKQVQLEGGFLSDAAGTFLFLDAMTLNWNGRTDTANPFSFFSLSADGKLRLFRYDAEELIYEEDLGENATGSAARGYAVDFIAGVYTGMDGSRRLLVSDPKLLTSLF